METYQERVGRYRIVKQDADMTAERRAIYRLNGIDPDDAWSLVWSFDDEAHAVAKLAELNSRAHTWVYRLVDGLQATTIERPVW